MNSPPAALPLPEPAQPRAAATAQRRAVARLRVQGAIAAINPADWDACAGDDNPFVSHRFLACLEDSGSVSPQTGWIAQHLVAEDAAGRLVGCVPLYAKTHSYGEYVFDHAWADALHRAGGRYYPKLQAAIPFTPVPGPRLLVAPDAAPDVAPALARGLIAATRERGFSSVHVTFAEDADMAVLTQAGFLERHGYQFHWHNRGYADFDDFLATLSSRKRKAVKKERREAAASGLTFRALTGDDLTPQAWEAFYHFYLATVDRKWGMAYLTRRFFDLLGERMGDRVLLMLAEDASGTPVAGALNLIGRDAIFGRNWGCIDPRPFLHFELCYYRAIDWAIAHRIGRVEAGAQGEHKLQRGYLPSLTRSAHWLADPGFARAVDQFLQRERAMVAEAMADLTAQSPFRHEDGE